jgi:hypothetical protein
MADYISSRTSTQCKNKFYKMENVIFTEILGIDPLERMSFISKRGSKPGSKAK